MPSAGHHSDGNDGATSVMITPPSSPETTGSGGEKKGEILLRTPGESYGSNPQALLVQIANLHLERIEEQDMKALCELSEKNRMPITQENGQRRYGPPLDYKQAEPPKKGAEVFVGKLPRNCFEPELVPVFEKAGRIYEMRIMMDFSGTNRGYCFVHYYTQEEADRAIRDLNNFEIRKGRQLGVTKSVDNCRLFFGELPRDKSENELRKEIDKLIDGVVTVELHHPRQAEKPAYAFIEFGSHKEAAMARRKLWSGRLKLWGEEIAVDWAEPADEYRDSVATYKSARNNQKHFQRSPPRNGLPVPAAQYKPNLAPRFMRAKANNDGYQGALCIQGSRFPVPPPQNFYFSVQQRTFGQQSYPTNGAQPETVSNNFPSPSNLTMGQFWLGVPGVPPSVYYGQWTQLH